jgi:hypothetical protein
MPNKPTGKAGSFRVQSDGCGVAGAYDPTLLPSTKDEIERHVVDVFTREGWRTFGPYFPFSDSKQNPQNDLDFTVRTPKGKALLELMEATNFDGTGRGYSEAPNSYRPTEFAARLNDAVRRKSAKYGSRRSEERFLLLYSTDFKFFPSPSVFQLLSWHLAQAPIHFDIVFFLLLLSQVDGEVRQIHPVDPAELTGFDPSRLANSKVIPLDPESWILSSGQRPTTPEGSA